MTRTTKKWATGRLFCVLDPWKLKPFQDSGSNMVWGKTRRTRLTWVKRMINLEIPVLVQSLKSCSVELGWVLLWETPVIGVLQSTRIRSSKEKREWVMRRALRSSNRSLPRRGICWAGSCQHRWTSLAPELSDFGWWFSSKSGLHGLLCHSFWKWKPDNVGVRPKLFGQRVVQSKLVFQNNSEKTSTSK